MKRLITFAKLSTLVAVFGLVALTPVTVGAADDDTNNSTGSSSKQQVCEGAGLSAEECAGQGGGLNGVITTIVQLLGAVAGVLAVIMVIVSGFRYITSGGDSAKVGAAKTALIYAIVGLVVVALSQIIVRFVLEKVS